MSRNCIVPILSLFLFIVLKMNWTQWPGRGGTYVRGMNGSIPETIMNYKRFDCIRKRKIYMVERHTTRNLQLWFMCTAVGVRRTQSRLSLKRCWTELGILKPSFQSITRDHNLYFKTISFCAVKKTRGCTLSASVVLSCLQYVSYEGKKFFFLNRTIIRGLG